MNKLVTLLGIGVFLLLIACKGQSETKSEQQGITVKESTAEKIYYYTCPMEEHKNVASDKPGDCPECGMKLVAAVAANLDSIDYYGCPMPEHSHVRQDKPGTCAECNMDLKPMRLDSHY
jgi:hypothetical protein